MKAYIKALTTYVPATVVTNEMLAEAFPEWQAEKIAVKIGIRQRHVTGPEETVSDMAVAVSEKLFAQSGFDRSKVDMVLLCTQTPDYFIPTTACLVQNRLGLPTTCGALDFNLGCSGYVYGLYLAKAIVTSGMAAHVLLITSEAYSKIIHPEDKSNRTIFGDGASATIISTEGFATIDDIVLGSDGTTEAMGVKTGAFKYPQKQGQVQTDEDGNRQWEDYWFMNGTAVFSFTLNAVPALIQQILDKASLSPDDIHYYIFHQANAFMLKHLQKKIGIPDEKFLLNMADTGNTVSATIPIVLEKYLQDNLFKSGDKILLAGFGVGFSWAGAVITVNS